MLTAHSTNSIGAPNSTLQTTSFQAFEGLLAQAFEPLMSGLGAYGQPAHEYNQRVYVIVAVGYWQ